MWLASILRKLFGRPEEVPSQAELPDSRPTARTPASLQSDAAVEAPPASASQKGEIPAEAASTPAPQGGEPSVETPPTPAPQQSVRPAKAPSPPKRVAAKRPSVRVNIGLDFGTNATKVVYRVGGGNVARVLSFEHEASDMPPYCYPSAMTCGPEGVYWGPSAHLKAEEGASVLRSLKSCVTCSASEGVKCLRDKDECVYRPAMKAFGFDPDVMTPPVAAAIFVAQALWFAKYRILQERGISILCLTLVPPQRHPSRPTRAGPSRSYESGWQSHSGQSPIWF